MGIFLWSRAVIWAAALFAFLAFEPNRSPAADTFDTPSLHDSGWFVDIWARWDSKWYVGIAEHGGYEWGGVDGYHFFPLYPFADSVLGSVLFGRHVLAGVLISLASACGAFVLLHRLAEERLGPEGARRAVLYLAVFPMTLFLQAVYAESLLLLLSLAAFYFAERGRWAEAWLSAGLAALTRISGLFLLPALVLIAWRSPDRRRAFITLPIAPALFSIFPFILWRQVDDPLGFLRSSPSGYGQRELSPAGPLGGLWESVDQAVRGVGRLITDGPAVRTGIALGDDSFVRADAYNYASLAFVALFIVLTVIVWRRFGAPYGLFAAVSLAVPLSSPIAGEWPLAGLPRYGLVVFPFFFALAWLGRRPWVHTTIVAVSSMLLGVAVVQWALWQWVT